MSICGNYRLCTRLCGCLRSFLWKWLGFLVLLAPLNSVASTKIHFNYYDITGIVGSDLQREMREKGPKGFAGYTQWNIHYSYKNQLHNNRCYLTDTNLSLDTTYTMPRWRNQSAASSELKSRWNGWYNVLEKHEFQHGEHGMQAYREIQSEFVQFGSAQNCSLLANELSGIVNRILAKFNKMDSDYDIATSHGLTEGASQNMLLSPEARELEHSAPSIVSSKSGALFKLLLPWSLGFFCVYKVARKTVT